MCTPGPFSFIFMQLLGKINQNNRLAPPICGVGVPFWEINDPLLFVAAFHHIFTRTRKNENMFSQDDMSSLRKFYAFRTLKISHPVRFLSIGFEFGIGFCLKGWSHRSISPTIDLLRLVGLHGI